MIICLGTCETNQGGDLLNIIRPLNDLNLQN